MNTRGKRSYPYIKVKLTEEQKQIFLNYKKKYKIHLQDILAEVVDNFCKTQDPLGLIYQNPLMSPVRQGNKKLENTKRFKETIHGEPLKVRPSFFKSDDNGVCDEDCATCGPKVQHQCANPEQSATEIARSEVQQMSLFDQMPEAMFLVNDPVVKPTIVHFQDERVVELLEAAKRLMKDRGGKPANYADYERFKRELTRDGWIDNYRDVISELTRILKI